LVGLGLSPPRLHPAPPGLKPPPPPVHGRDTIRSGHGDHVGGLVAGVCFFLFVIVASRFWFGASPGCYDLGGLAGLTSCWGTPDKTIVVEPRLW